ncbi:UbiD family decarboxylase [Thermodesulfobacteriota bacterium]
MKFDDLREFIEALEAIGELKRVEGAHWDLEVGAITELMAERKGPALLFDRIGDYPAGYRVLSNAFASLKRTSLVFGIPEDLDAMGVMKAWREKLKEFEPVSPVEVESGPVKENIYTGEAVNLLDFPAPKWHEPDGGRYLGTGSAVIIRDPEEGWINVGTYRCMIYDQSTISVKINPDTHGRQMMDKYHAKGQPCPIAIAFGQDPALWMAATDQGVPWGMSEYDFAGWLRNEPIEVVKGEATDLPVPATAEIVIEGEIPLPGAIEPRQEGPFGEWTGYCADTTRGLVPIMIVKSVLHRNDPIILGVPPMKPPVTFRCAFPVVAASIWDQMEKAGIRGVTGVWIPVFENAAVVVVSIKQLFPGHAKEAGVVAAACGAARVGPRFIIVVDDDVDITNLEDVVWAVATRCSMEINILKGLRAGAAETLLTLEQRRSGQAVGARMIIDGCRPYGLIKDFPPVNVFSSEYRQKVTDKWQELFNGSVSNR